MLQNMIQMYQTQTITFIAFDGRSGYGLKVFKLVVRKEEIFAYPKFYSSGTCSPNARLLIEVLSLCLGT